MNNITDTYFPPSSAELDLRYHFADYCKMLCDFSMGVNHPPFWMNIDAFQQSEPSVNEVIEMFNRTGVVLWQEEKPMMKVEPLTFDEFVLQREKPTTLPIRPIEFYEQDFTFHGTPEEYGEALASVGLDFRNDLAKIPHVKKPTVTNPLLTNRSTDAMYEVGIDFRPPPHFRIPMNDKLAAINAKFARE